MITYKEIKDLITYNWVADFTSFYCYHGDRLENLTCQTIWNLYLGSRHRLN